MQLFKKTSLLLPLLFFSLVQLSFGQMDKIIKQVDKNNELAKEKKNQKKILRKDNVGNQAQEFSNDPERGRAILATDPDLFDPSLPSIGGAPKASDEPELPEERIFIDTTDFKSRIFSVKRRDMLAYRNGLSSRAPIINHEPYQKEHELKPEVKVFGWHPYWMKDAYQSYNFSLLSVVAYFSYEVNPRDGSYLNIHDWATTPLVEEAQAQGCRVLLSVSNFGEQNNQLFLSNIGAQRKCIEQAIRLVEARSADGIHLDFEEIPVEQKQAFTNFVLDFASQLKRSLPDAWLTLSLPTLDFERVYDLKQLEHQVDLFVMMGYEFYGSNTDQAGPIAPIHSGSLWWELDLETAVDDYLATGIDPSKLLLTFPYYGAEWVTEGLQVPSQKRKFLSYQMYRDIRKKRLSPNEEPESFSTYTTYRDSENNYRQIWYEDTLSLAKKYDWLLQKKIGGAAIWALGYDNGYQDLWKVLALKFAQPEATPNTKQSWSFWRRILMRGSYIARNPSVLVKNPRYLFSIFGILTGTSMLGFFTLYRYGCRFKRSFNLALKGSVAFILFIMLALLFVVVSNFNSTYMTAAAFLVGGFIIGAIVFLFISRRFLSEKELP